MDSQQAPQATAWIHNRHCWLQPGFTIGAVGYSADSQQALQTAAIIHNKHCRLQCGFTIGAVGNSVDSQQALQAAAWIHNRRHRLQREFTIGAVGYSGNSQQPLQATAWIHNRRHSYSVDSQQALQATTWIHNRRCRLQRRFTIGAVGYSVDSQKALQATAQIQNLICFLQQGVNYCFLCIFSNICNSKNRRHRLQRGFKQPLQATAGIQNSRCRVQWASTIAAVDYSGNFESPLYPTVHRGTFENSNNFANTEQKSKFFQPLSLGPIQSGSLEKNSSQTISRYCPFNSTKYNLKTEGKKRNSQS